ncbi:P-loop containing nucleoside triphosphate hydrolase protein [Hyaloraphidium curvatum]|nr:P-loop containing nucleoside triphosphate hydrolase protein [Hyaloraphidium curvatum]
MPKRTPKSKRLPARKKYKIERKVREHHRKEKKSASAKGKRSRSKKDPGIPNNFPFKAELIEQIQQQKQKRAEEVRNARVAKAAQKANGLGGSLEELAASAARRGDAFDEQRGNGESSGHGDYETLNDNSKRAFYREFQKVVEESDVVLEVLDARDPMGTRAMDVEERIRTSAKKRLILVLNKIDLVPKANLEKWLKYLRREYPTVAFKASTQTQRNNLGRAKVSVTDASASMLQSSESLGADTLMQLLKNYCRNAGIRTSITVGVVGFPNVGKSSLINSLKRSKVCDVGAVAGITRTAQHVVLDKNIHLIDSPGIVFGRAKEDGSNSQEIMLRNAIRVESIEDPIAPVEYLLSRCRPEDLSRIYKVPSFANLQEFLIDLARTRGRLRKGGIPDTASAARQVLQDWNRGRIPFHTEPPAVDTSSISAAIVEEWSNEFSLPAVIQTERDLIDGLPEASVRFATMSGAGVQEADWDVEMDDSDSDEDASGADDSDEEVSGSEEGDSEGMNED